MEVKTEKGRKYENEKEVKRNSAGKLKEEVKRK